ERGSGYFSPVAPARLAALAPSERPESARPHAAAATTIVRKTTLSSVTALAGLIACILFQIRAPCVPIGFRFERLRRGVNRLLVERLRGDLQPERQPRRHAGEPHRQDEGGKAARVEHPAERLPDVDPLAGRRRHARREEDVDRAERCGELP